MQQLKITQNITVRTNGLDIYLNQISKLPMITPDEEVELAGRIHQGDEEAFQRLVEANLRFVVSVAKQYHGHGVPLVDTINDGNIGLMKAARDFDETRGFKFISYAVWWIRQSILQGLADNSRMVRLPLNQVGLQGKINKAVSEFEQEHGRLPDENELSEMIDFPAGKIREAQRSSGHHMSYDAPFEDGEDGTLLDVLKNDNVVATDAKMDMESLSTDIDRALMVLSERDRNVIRQCFGIGCQELGLDEIGENMGLSRERVRQIKEKALRTLRKSGVAKMLKKY